MGNMERTQETGRHSARRAPRVLLGAVRPGTRIVFPSGSSGFVQVRRDDGDIDVYIDGVGEATFSPVIEVEIDTDFPDLPLAGGVH